MAEKLEILLAVRPRAVRELLERALTSQEDIDVVGEVLEPLDLLVAVR